MGIATSTAGWVNALLLAVSLYAKGEFNPGRETIRNIIMILVASAVMAGVLYIGDTSLKNQLLHEGLMVRIVAVLGLVTVSALIYFALVLFSGAVPKDQLRRMISR